MNDLNKLIVVGLIAFGIITAILTSELIDISHQVDDLIKDRNMLIGNMGYSQNQIDYLTYKVSEAFNDSSFYYRGD